MYSANVGYIQIENHQKYEQESKRLYTNPNRSHLTYLSSLLAHKMRLTLLTAGTPSHYSRANKQYYKPAARWPQN